MRTTWVWEKPSRFWECCSIGAPRVLPRLRLSSFFRHRFSAIGSTKRGVRAVPSIAGRSSLRGERANRALPKVDVVLTTYGMVSRLDWLRQREWSFAILDESQAIKNPGARQTKAVKQLRAPARIALTGTPVENSLGDLWSLFDFSIPDCSAARRSSAEGSGVGRTRLVPAPLSRHCAAWCARTSSPSQVGQIRHRRPSGQDGNARSLFPDQAPGRALRTVSART